MSAVTGSHRPERSFWLLGNCSLQNWQLRTFSLSLLLNACFLSLAKTWPQCSLFVDAMLIHNYATKLRPPYQIVSEVTGSSHLIGWNTSVYPKRTIFSNIKPRTISTNRLIANATLYKDFPKIQQNLWLVQSRLSVK